MQLSLVHATLMLPSLILSIACYTGPLQGERESSATGAQTPSDDDSTRRPLSPSVLILVEDENGLPIAGATIIPHYEDETVEPSPVPALPGGPVIPRIRRQDAVRTNSEGLALLQGLDSGLFTFEVRQRGYSSAVGQASLDSDSAVSRQVRLQRTSTARFEAGAGLLGLEHRGVRVVVPPHGLVYEGGHREEPDPNNPGQTLLRSLDRQPVEGEVLAELAVVHPSSVDPAEIPGPLIGTSDDGSLGGMLISGGMIEFRMSQDGVPIQPAPGGNVKLSLSLEDVDVDPQIREALNEGLPIPKWVLDPVRGRWIHEGFWTPEPDSNGGMTLTTLQSHFTWLNVDIPGTPYCHRLLVRNSDGTPKSNAIVHVKEAPWHLSVTGDDGIICMEAPGTIHASVCGKVIELKPQDQTVSACTEGYKNLALWLGNYKGPYDDENCPIHEVYCVEPICTPNEWKYCGDLQDLDDEVGICQNSKQYCIDGTHWSACSTKVEPEVEECGKTPAFDDDCDGAVDDGCDCTKPSDQACYPGSPGELDKQKFPQAICAAGAQMCLMQGVWDECSGYTMGESEDCNTPDIDENCDGLSACLGGAAWASAADEDPIPLQGEAIAVAPKEAFVVTGMNAATGGGLTPVLCDQGNIKSLDEDGLLVKYGAAQGECVQVRRVGGPGVSRITDVAVGENNQVLIVGEFSGTLDKDEYDGNMCGELVADKNGPHLFIGKYDADLNCLQREVITAGSGQIRDARMSLHADGHAFITAQFKGEITLVKAMNPPPIQSPPDNSDGVVLEVRALKVVPNNVGRVDAVALIDSAFDAGDQIPQDIALGEEALVIAGYFTEALGPSMNTAIGHEWFARRYTLVKGHLTADVPYDYYALLTGDQEATSVALAGNALIVGGFSNTQATGIKNCDSVDLGSHGFIAYDLQYDPNAKTHTSVACARLTGPSHERIFDLALIEDAMKMPPQVDVVALGRTQGTPAPVEVDVITGGVYPTPCGDKSYILDGDQGMDALALRVSFAEPGCQWLQRMPQHLTTQKVDPPGPPYQVTDIGSEQCAWRLAADPSGDSFSTGWFKEGIGFAPGTTASINLTGGAQYRTFIAKFYP